MVLNSVDYNSSCTMQALVGTDEVESVDPTMLIPTYKTKCVTVQNLDVSGNVTTVRQCAPALSLVELGKKLLLSAKEGDTEQVRLLMSKGAPFTTDWLGTSPLHLAAQYGHVATAEVLLRAGISRDARTKVERTPLHIAAQEGNTAIVHLLLAHGAEVDSKDMLRMTPLHWAVEREHVDTVEVLLQNGANPHEVSKFDKTSFHIAQDNNRQDIVQLLQAAAERLSPLQTVSVSAAEQAMEDATLTATQSLAVELAQVPTPAHQEEVQTSATASSTAEAVSLQSTPVERREVLAQSIKKAKTSINTEGSPHQKKQRGSATLQLLQAHGITMLPADETTLVASAVENGQTVVLTEAGKLALNLTQETTNNKTTGNMAAIVHHKTTPITLPATAKKKVITIRAGQLIGKTGPNILKRIDPDNLGGPPTKLLVTRTGIPISTASKNAMNNVTLTVPNVSDLATITRQLQEARREAEEYKKLYSRKEREAEEYKQQLQNITQAK